MLKARCMWNLGVVTYFLVSRFGNHVPSQNWVQSNNFVRYYRIMGVICMQTDTLLKER